MDWIQARRCSSAAAVAVLVGTLELLHPSWSGDAVAQAVVDAQGWWVLLHLLLIVGYGALVWALWPDGLAAQVLLSVFLALNTAYIAVDGVVVGALASVDPITANTLWTSPVVAVLANLTGAAWSASLLATAMRNEYSRPKLAGSALIWLTFVLGSVLPVAGLVSRLAALGTVAWAVYTTGVKGLPFALLAFAAVLHQHVGAEAAFGMLCIALAFALRERSVPAAAFRP